MSFKSTFYSYSRNTFNKQLFYFFFCGGPEKYETMYFAKLRHHEQNYSLVLLMEIIYLLKYTERFILFVQSVIRKLSSTLISFLMNIVEEEM